MYVNVNKFPDFQLITSSPGVVEKESQQPLHHGCYLENPEKVLENVELS